MVRSLHRMRDRLRKRGGSPGQKPGEHVGAPADAATLIRDSGLFDRAWYADQLDAPAQGDPVEHYLTVGAAAGRSPHPLFDPAAYLARHAEVEVADALVHFLRWAQARLETSVEVPPAAGVRRGRTSIVVTTRGTSRATARCVRALAAASAGDHEILLVDNASAGATSHVCLLLEDELPRVRVVHSAAATSDALARNLGAAAATGDVLVFLSVFVTVERGWIDPLRASLDAGACAVQPRVLALDGTIVTTGMTLDDAGTLHDALATLPGDDPMARMPARRLAADFSCVAVSAEQFAAVGGFADLPAPVAAADLSLRLTAAGHGIVRYEPACSVVNSRPRRATAGDEPAWEALADRVRVLPPVVLRPRTRAPETLRWAVKVSPPFARRRRWGDYHFAQGMARALERLGQEVVVDTHEAWYRESADLDDVVLALRGLLPYQPSGEHVNLLWVISHSDDVSAEELAAYDHAFVAAVHPRGPAGGDGGITVETLLQATDAHRFTPGAAEPDLRADVLFVGNSRWQLRPVVRDALAAGLPLSVYGDGWTDFLPDGVLRGDLIPNERLPRYYRSAAVVLNDHWDDMRRDGLLSNRLFDLAACAAVVVTDEVDGMDTVFGDVLHTYSEPAEIGPLVRRLLVEPEADARRRLELAEHIRARHSFDVRAQRLLEVARSLAAAR